MDKKNYIYSIYVYNFCYRNSLLIVKVVVIQVPKVKCFNSPHAACVVLQAAVVSRSTSE